MGKKKGGGVRIKQVGPKGPSAQNLQAALNPLEELSKGINPQDMVNLPPPPDRSYQVFWPITETFTMKTDGFQVIYPSYVDATKTVKQGRRISKENAVGGSSPTVSDLSLALQSLQIRHVLQPYKGYSRDATTIHDNPGRVLADITSRGHRNKLELLKEVAAVIPTLPERAQRLKREEEERAKEEEERRAYLEKERKENQAGDGRAITAGASSGTSGKKGKKGRKK